MRIRGHPNTVTISGLTVTNGNCGIYSDHSTLTVSNCVVTANKGGSLFGIGINGILGPTTRVERGITAIPGNLTAIVLLFSLC